MTKVQLVSALLSAGLPVSPTAPPSALPVPALSVPGALLPLGAADWPFTVLALPGDSSALGALPGPEAASPRSELLRASAAGEAGGPVYDAARPAAEAADVIVIGGGPAGLSTAHELSKRGLKALILERSSFPGASWRGMPRNLVLLSHWSLDRLPDSPRHLEPEDRHPSAERFARYLQDYAMHHDLSVRPHTEVSGIERGPDGVWTATASDGRTFRGRAVVNATGYFGKPFVPSRPGARESPIPQLHFAQYKTAQDLIDRLGGAGKALIVGKRISSGQLVTELHHAGFQTVLSARGPIRFLPGPPWPDFYERYLLPPAEWLLTRLRLGPKVPPDLPMQGGETRRLIRSGAVRTMPDIARFEGKDIVFEGGRREPFDVVVYATGFRPALDHLGVVVDPATRLPKLHGFESAERPGLYFIGLNGLRSFRSRFLKGIREDAPALARRLASELLPLPPPPPPSTGLRRIWRVALGTTLLVIGLIMMPVPGPGGIPLTLAGLIILAREYKWAARILAWAKKRLEDLRY